MQGHHMTPQEYDPAVEYSSMGSHLAAPNLTYGSLNSEGSDSGYDSLGHDGESDGGREGCMCYACGDPSAAKDEDFLFLFRPLEGHTITLCERTDGQVKEHKLARVHFGNTRYLRQFLKPNLHHRPLKFDVGQLCRDHQRGRCTRGVMCRFLHICRKLPIQAPHPLAATSSQGGSRPGSSAASTTSSHSGRASARSTTPEWSDSEYQQPIRGRGYSQPTSPPVGAPGRLDAAGAAFLQQLALALAQQPALLAQTAALAAAQAAPPPPPPQPSMNPLSLAALSLAAANPNFNLHGYQQAAAPQPQQQQAQQSYSTLTSNILNSLLSGVGQQQQQQQPEPAPQPQAYAPSYAQSQQSALLSSLLNPALYAQQPSAPTQAPPPQQHAPPGTTGLSAAGLASLLGGVQQAQQQQQQQAQYQPQYQPQQAQQQQQVTSPVSVTSPQAPVLQPDLNLEDICRQLRQFATSFDE